jgi:hypothetical protein
MFMQPLPPRPDAAERTERHLAAVAELFDDARRLARHAARKALRHAEAEAEAHAAGLPPPQLPRPTGPDPGEAFCRMSREVCRLIALETRIANGWKDLGRDRMKDLRTERRRTRVRQIMHEAVWVQPGGPPGGPPGGLPGGPDRETALQTVDLALEDDEIVEMLEDDVLIGDVVVAICRGCDLLVDADLLPNDARQTTGPLFPPVHRPPAPREPASEQGPDPP